MRNPVRGEADAFRLAVGGAGLVGASLALGALASEAAGIALFGGGVVGAVIWEISTKDVDRRLSLREAASEGSRAQASSRRRVLVIANRTLAGGELRTLLRRRGE